MTVKHTLVSLDMRVFALCSLMELHRAKHSGRQVKLTYMVIGNVEYEVID